MGVVVPPDPVKVFIAVLHDPSAPIDHAKELCVDELGPIDYQSEAFPFTFTDYYAKEMGADLLRRFWSFERLGDPANLVEVKQSTNQIERQFVRSGRRTINLDAGYLDFHKVVLASTKFGGSKIYLHDGIFADITLWYEKGTYKPFVWGFPDFKSGVYSSTLLHIRELYKVQRQGH